MTIKEILNGKSNAPRLALFNFDDNDSADRVLFKFNLWVRYFFPKFFEHGDAPFHGEIDRYNLAIYRGGIIKSFTDIAFRGGAKTTRTKLLLAFCIANDKARTREYIKVLSKDLTNSKQTVTDIYNMYVDPRVHNHYPEIFAKTEFKREETMSSFTTATGVKVSAGTVGTDQRGQIAEASRPDLIWFDDFETRKSLRSAVETKAIWDNMEEAKNGLAKDGGSIYTCNYISERGNVHKLVTKEAPDSIVLIIPIIKDGVPAWDIYTVADIASIEASAEDYGGEYLCSPAASSDVLFARDILTDMLARAKEPIRNIAGLKIYSKYDPSHRYAVGADISGGVGLDSSTAVVIDFDVIPCRVVATYRTNTVKPDAFGYELQRIGDFYGQCLVAPEKNNHGHATIAILKQIYELERIFNTPEKDAKINTVTNIPPKEYGWHTNAATKPKMLFALKKAVEDGLLDLVDPDLIREAMGYSRDDLMDAEIDPRLTTRHFDLLIAAAIAWQMKDYAEVAKSTIPHEFVEEEPMFADIGV